MWLFGQIVLAVVLVIAVIALVGYLWLRRWLKRRLGDFEVVARIIDPHHALPARIRLQADVDQQASEALRAQFRPWQELGFTKLGDFAEVNGAFELVRVAVDPQGRFVLALAEDTEERLASVLFVLTGEKRLLASATGLGPLLDSRAMHWSVDDQLDAQARLQSLQQRIGDSALQTLDARTAKAAFERAYALLVDADIASGPPHLAQLEKRAGAIKPQPSPAQLEQALVMAQAQWRDRLEQASLDNWRRSSRIDAVTWERLEGEIQVVEQRIDLESLGSLLCEDEQSERLFEQLAAQGLSGQALYREVQQRLPARSRRIQVGDVRRPLPALLFSRDDEQTADSDDRGARAHAFEARDGDGRAVQSTVLARNAGDARQQIEAMGLSNARVVMEPLAGLPDSDLDFDPDLAQQAVRSIREPIGVSMLRSLLASAWIWLPAAGLLAWSLWQGAPFTWGDWLIFVYAVAAVVAMTVLIAPMLVYNLMLRAKLLGHWRRAQRRLAVLRRLNLLGAISADQLLAEHCKLLAAQGKTEAALAQWRARESEMSREFHLSELAQIHDAAGDVDAMIAVQRVSLEIAASKDMPRVDLAMSLARFKREVDEAEDLIGQLSVTDLSELVLCGYHYTRGLILAERSQYDAALKHLQQAIALAQQFQSNPMIAGLIAEINGYLALTLRAQGNEARANALWQSVTPILKVNASSRGLVARYEAGSALGST